MFNGLNMSDASDYKFGSQQVSYVYYSSHLIWPQSPTPPTPPTPYASQYLTIESLANNNTISWVAKTTHINDVITPKTIQYSLDDGQTWQSITSSLAGATITTLNSGEKILLKGSNTNYFDRYLNPGGYDYDTYSQINSTDNISVYGNIMSLIYDDQFENNSTLPTTMTFTLFFSGNSYLIDTENLILPATTLTGGCYNGMFMSCSSLTAGPVLPATTLATSSYEYMFARCSALTTAPLIYATILANYCCSNMFYDCTALTTAHVPPATTLADHCYERMFEGCTSLTTAPTLPATTLADYCYEYMFFGCTALTTAPILHATTLMQACYAQMFNGCTSLITAPELSATTLMQACYYGMFNGCTSLNDVRCYAQDISATNCTSIWLGNVAASGTFIKDANTTWPSGSSGIPTGWTVIDL